VFTSGDESRYEPYPPEINVVIEKAYRQKKGSVFLEESGVRFEVDFVRMVQEKVGITGKAVKVKRNTNGL